MGSLSAAGSQRGAWASAAFLALYAQVRLTSSLSVFDLLVFDLLGLGDGDGDSDGDGDGDDPVSPRAVRTRRRIKS